MNEMYLKSLKAQVNKYYYLERGRIKGIMGDASAFSADDVGWKDNDSGVYYHLEQLASILKDVE